MKAFMLLDYLIHHGWAAALSIGLIYVSDYYWTIKCSKLYKEGADKHFVYEGGIELNPIFRKDIEKAKRSNPKFIVILIGLVLLVYLTWYNVVLIHEQTGLFEFLLGILILTEVFVHTRHSYNFYQFHAAKSSDGISGQIKFERYIMHKLAKKGAYTFAFLYFAFYLLIGRVFFLGGAIECLLLGLMQKKWFKKNLKSINL